MYSCASACIFICYKIDMGVYIEVEECALDRIRVKSYATELGYNW